MLDEVGELTFDVFSASFSRVWSILGLFFFGHAFLLVANVPGWRGYSASCVCCSHRDADGFFDPVRRVGLLGFGQRIRDHRGQRTDILLVKAEDIGRFADSQGQAPGFHRPDANSRFGWLAKQRALWGSSGNRFPRAIFKVQAGLQERPPFLSACSRALLRGPPQPPGSVGRAHPFQELCI